MDFINYEVIIFPFQIVFSSLFEYVEAFTRDYDKIKSSLNNLHLYDKTFIEAGLTAATSIIVDEWGYVTPCQVTQIFILLSTTLFIPVLTHVSLYTFVIY